MLEGFYQKQSFPKSGAIITDVIGVKRSVVYKIQDSCRHSNNVKKIVKGLMIESHIEDGAQKPEECVYGKSTIGCENTEKLICDLADIL